MTLLKSPAADQIVRALLSQYHPQMKLANKHILAEAFLKALTMGAINAWWLEMEESQYERKVEDCVDQVTTFDIPKHLGPGPISLLDRKSNENSLSKK